ncbi:hypothetical protein RB201_20400 [Streptomyces sp. S1A(2023)]
MRDGVAGRLHPRHQQQREEGPQLLPGQRPAVDRRVQLPQQGEGPEPHGARQPPEGRVGQIDVLRGPYAVPDNWYGTVMPITSTVRQAMVRLVAASRLIDAARRSR